MSVHERHQHLERNQIELTDQHGRTWLVTTEIGKDKSGRPRMVPVGQFFPHFKAPYDFVPDAKYLKYDARRPSELRIDYAGWRSAIAAAHEEVHRQVVDLATKLYKAEAAKYIAEPSSEMLEIIYGKGRGPEPVEPVIAAMQGNGWILGLRPYDEDVAGDVKLKEYLEQWVATRYRDFRTEDGEDAGGYGSIDFTEGQAKTKRRPATAAA